MDRRTVYGWLAISALVVGCGPSSDVSPLNTRKGPGPKTFREDAVLKPTDAAEGFLGAIGNEEFGQAIKQFSTVGFQGRYSSSTLRELIERDGKGLVGWRSREPLAPVSQTADSKLYRCEVGGGPHGSARVEITVSQDENGWRVSEFVVVKK
jgi:hypothetical protein